MGTTKKRRARKKFRYINRKKLNIRRTKIKTKIKCDVLKEEWDDKKSAKQNLRNMGLAFDSNISIKIPALPKQQPAEKGVVPVEKRRIISKKGHVVDALEADAKAPRQRMFRLPKSQVEWITYLMDKHGEDYKAMERDSKNYYQETWKQLRAKVKQFRNIPEQFNAYLQSKCETSIDDN